MHSKILLSAKLYFSYNQFLVYDASVRLPACDWTEAHFGQGFAKRKSTVCFGSILEFGYAHVTAVLGRYRAEMGYDRVIAVPFFAASGVVIVEGPEEAAPKRRFTVNPCTYRLTAAQFVLPGPEQEERIDLFFEELHEPLPNSVILVADGALRPPRPLLETAGIAGK
ncbi:MAG: competence protein ComJ [Verrucomicrobiota bacterium]|jgi:hypothetical protein